MADGFRWLTPQEEADIIADEIWQAEAPAGLPTILNPQTGRFEEVDPVDARARGIPLGEPRPSGGRPTGGLEMPGGPAPSYYSPTTEFNQNLTAQYSPDSEGISTDTGLPEGLDWVENTDQGYQDGVASTFGYNDPIDSGIGAWGDNTNTPDAWGVSLPIETLRQIFGDDDAAYGAVVELLNPATGQTVRAPIVDKGPADWVIARQGPTIDVTEGVRREMGLTGLDPMQWRVLGHGVEPDKPAAAPGGLPGGLQWVSNTTIPEGGPEVTTGLPEGLEWVEEKDDGLFGFEVREELTSGEKDYFEKHPEVSGMAADDDKIILNQMHAPPGVNMESVARNEAFRLKMRKDKITPSFDLTPDQKAAFKGTEYGKDESALKQTIAARIYSGDPSARATSEQEKWTQDFVDQTQEGEDIIPLEPVSERPGGVAAPEEGVRWVEEPPGVPLPVEQGGTRAEAGAKRRQTLIDAIARTEASGFPVEHTIGLPNEPEGDRAPTRDMENLVGALRQAEKASAARGNTQAAAAAAGERVYWETIIKEEGMSEEQAQASEAIIETGNIDLSNRPVVQNKDGSTSTIRSISISENGVEILIPTVVNGKVVDTKDAIDHYHATGEHLGKFKDEKSATVWADVLHKQEERRIKQQPEALTPSPAPVGGVARVAPPAAPADFVPEWQRPAAPVDQGKQADPLDALNMFARGASSEGVLAGFEGGYAIMASLLPEGTIKDNAVRQRDQVAAMRDRVRKQHLPVDREWEESTLGGIFQGTGQMATSLPLYALGPLVGTAAGGMLVVSQLFDEQRQDYIQTRKSKGEKVDEAEASKAALAYVTAAGPMEILMDRFLIKKFLKPLAGKATVGEVIKAGASAGWREGLTESLQTAWGNFVASDLSGYDPKRPFTKQMWQSFLIGGGVGLIGGGAARVAAPTVPAKAPAREGFPIPAAEDAKLARMKEALEKAESEKKFAPAASRLTPEQREAIERAAKKGVETYGPAKAPVAEEEEGGEGISGPTSDAELEAMIKKYETGTEQTRAVQKEATVGIPGLPEPKGETIGSRAVAKASWDKLSRAQRGQQNLPYFEQLKKQADALGIPFQIKEGSGSSGGIVYNSIGEISLRSDPELLFLREKGSNLPSGAETRVLVGEETIHAADIIGLKAEWDNSQDKKDGVDFVDYVNLRSDSVLRDIENTVNSSPEKDTLKQTLADASALYFGSYSGEASAPTRPESIFQDIRQAASLRGPGRITAFIKEFIRMAKQQEKQGIISEHTARRLVDIVKDWVNAAIARIVKSLPGVRAGKFGTEAQRELRRIDEWLERLGQGKDLVPAISQTERVMAETQKAPPREGLAEKMRKFVGMPARTPPLPGATEQAIGTRPGKATVNIGLATDSGEGITVNRVLEALSDAGVNVTSYRVQQSGTEPTVVAYLDKTLDENEAFKLSEDLNQQAIAEAWVGGAELYGPGAEAWRPFNPEYFLAQKNPDPELARGIDELEQLAKDYSKWKTWYKDFSAFLDRVLLPENRIYKPLITDFMAALSVQTGIKPNVQQSIVALREFVETGAVSSKSVGFPARGKLPNIMKALRGEQLGGPKVGPFSQALRLNPNAAAIDRHVAMILFNTRSPSAAQIRVGQRVAGEIAQRLGWETAEVQAAWWAAGKELFGERGKVVETYEQFFEQRKDELNSILTQDRAGEGRGLQAVGAVPGRAGESERLPGTRGPPRGREQVLATRGPVTPVAERKLVQRVISSPISLFKTTLEGKKFSPHLTRPIWDWVEMSRFYNATARVFDRSPGLEYLGRAIRKHLDLRSKYRGEFNTRAADAYHSIPVTKRAEALEGFRQYWINNQKAGRNFANNQPLSKHAQKLVDVSRELFEAMGTQAAGKIRIYNPETKHWYPFRPRVDPFKDYFPHTMRDDIMDVLRNPSDDPAVWNELQDEMIAEGIIPGIDPDTEMLKHVNTFLDHYKVNGFFGSLERARLADFPTKAYDYSYKTLLNYIDSWSERMAQTEAFGQGSATQRTIWDVAAESAGNKATSNYIKNVRDRAYNQSVESFAGRAALVLNNIAILSHLANWFTASKNFLSGQGHNWQQFGTATFLRSFAHIGDAFKNVEGREKGILMNDMMNILQDGESLGVAPVTSKVAGLGLKATGYNWGEFWVRGTAMRGSRIAFQQGMDAYNRKRKGIKSRQFLGYLNRLGFNAKESHDLMMERGIGPLFDRYMRAVVNDIQGGYTYGHAPLIADTPVGRVYLKYSKWGLEQLQRFSLNVTKPFVRAISLGQFGTEKVEIVNDQGQKETVSVPGAIMPMVRYLWVLALVGAGIEWEMEKVFGIFAKTASWAEVMKKMKTDKAQALADAADKLFVYLMQAGATGYLGNLLQIGKDIGTRVRTKNPIEPPALAVPKQVFQSLLDLMDQETVTVKDLDDFATKVLGGYKRGKQVVARAADVMGEGTGYRFLEAQSRRMDFNWVRSVTRRYDEEIGVRQRIRTPGVYGKSPETPFRDALFEDLMLGDTKQASKRIEEHFKQWEDTPERYKQEVKNLRASMSARQPVKAGAGGGDREAGRQNFLRWAQLKLPTEEVARIKRVDKTYRQAAQAIIIDGDPLMRADEIVPEVNLERALQRIQIMAQ